MRAFVVNINVDATAALGDRGILVSALGLPNSTHPSLGLLNVVEPSL
jgi:hypothetical protein